MGSKKSKTTEKYDVPDWVESGSKQALSLAQQYASTPYQAYEGDRVASLGANEQLGADLAANESGAYKAPLAEARTRFSEADMTGYMNPYIENVINPGLRDLSQVQAQKRNQMAGALTSSGAYGSRAALQIAESDRLADQTAADFAGTQRFKAFEAAADRWDADQKRIMDSIGVEQSAINSDFKRLMASGEIQRYVDQLQKDFDYQQFVEGRDWSGKQAAVLTDVLRGIQGSYDTKRTSKTKQGSSLGQVLGAAVAVGSMFTPGGMLAGGGSIANWFGASQTRQGVDNAIEEAASGALG